MLIALITNNSLTSVTIPAHCSGGTTTVTWTITDLCDTITLSAQFIVTPAPAVTYNQPSDLTTAACSYTAQAGIDAAFATGGLLLRLPRLLKAGWMLTADCAIIVLQSQSIPAHCSGGTT
jgi:large repetitive protein